VKLQMGYDEGHVCDLPAPEKHGEVWVCPACEQHWVVRVGSVLMTPMTRSNPVLGWQRYEEVGDGLGA
jgi:hypothetical protein